MPAFLLFLLFFVCLVIPCYVYTWVFYIHGKFSEIGLLMSAGGRAGKEGFRGFDQSAKALPKPGAARNQADTYCSVPPCTPSRSISLQTRVRLYARTYIIYIYIHHRFTSRRLLLPGHPPPSSSFPTSVACTFSPDNPKEGRR